MKLITIVAVVSLVAPASLCAQDAASGPRAGAWGAEVNFDADNTALGGALLRFRNDRSAWIVGFDGFVGRREVERGLPFEDTVDNTLVGVSGRAGIRSFRSPAASVRPILGGGILGRTAHTGGISKTWEAGVYGELGIARFFGQNFSIGVLTDLQLSRSETRAGSFRATDLRAGFDALRMTATVIF